MRTNEVINIASDFLEGLKGHSFDVIEVAKPVSPEAAVNLAKIISKLSPLVGNLIEFNTCEYLNDQEVFKNFGQWKRQDPGFPDTVFIGDIQPIPGLEIKAWFPLATEITARFKDSQNHFLDDQTHVVILAWLPEYLVFGKPKIIDLIVVSGGSIASARDRHYHNPPGYIVLEPQDTILRTVNLQQTNTSGYKFQGDGREFEEACKVVQAWGVGGGTYLAEPNYQAMVRQLLTRFPYREDTNYAKIDRIKHDGIEGFKKRVHQKVFHGCTIGYWQRLLASGNEDKIMHSLKEIFDIRDDGASVVE